MLSGLPAMAPFDFTGEQFPPTGHERALDFFFAATLQQFGFWRLSENRYQAPAKGFLGGTELKGSDYLWAAYRRWLESRPEALTPGGQAALEAVELAARLAADDGGRPLPMFGERLRLARSYGQGLTALGLEPAGLVERANAAARPVEELLKALGGVGGYREDPLRKKAALLALILRQRPERFLRAVSTDDVPPIVDYHVQRSCLRMGLVRAEDPGLAVRLARREVVAEAEEQEVRMACRDVMAELATATGLGMGPVDWFFFQNRKRCPEMVEPACERCPVEAVCARKTELFQPVRRTTFY